MEKQGSGKPWSLHYIMNFVDAYFGPDYFSSESSGNLLFFYYPFFLSTFILDKWEEQHTAYDIFHNCILNETIGIKLFISSRKQHDSHTSDQFPSLPASFNKEKIEQTIKGKFKNFRVAVHSSGIVFFPCCIANSLFQNNKKKESLTMYNLNTGTKHSISKDIFDTTIRMFSKKYDVLDRKTNGRTLQRMDHPAFIGTCDLNYIYWLVKFKSSILHEAYNIEKAIFRYTPFYIFQYYSRRARTLKKTQLCSISAVTGAWSGFAHNLLHYDQPDYIVSAPVSNSEYQNSEIKDSPEIDKDQALKIARENLTRQPGVINYRILDHVMYYYPMWTVYIKNKKTNLIHKIEVCANTGYVVFEEKPNISSDHNNYMEVVT